MTLRETQILAEALKFVEKKSSGNTDGHDRFHLARVRRLASRLAHEMGANVFIVELAALLHDVADPKLNVDVPLAESQLREFLTEMKLSHAEFDEVLAIVLGQSYSKTLGIKNQAEPSLEFQIVQDADRLDAIGAIGIARCFAYGGAQGNVIHDPEYLPRTKMTPQEYREGKQSSLNHFHEKLFLLHEKLNTPLARQWGQARDRYMRDFVDRFLNEWEALP